LPCSGDAGDAVVNVKKMQLKAKVAKRRVVATFFMVMGIVDRVMLDVQPMVDGLLNGDGKVLW
jgi:hypothetical protein